MAVSPPLLKSGGWGCLPRFLIRISTLWACNQWCVLAWTWRWAGRMPGKADVALEEQVKGQHHAVPALVVQIPCYWPEESKEALGRLRAVQLEAVRLSGKRLYSTVGQGEKSKAKQGTWEAYFIWLLPLPLQLFYFRLFTRPEFFLYSSLLTVVSLLWDWKELRVNYVSGSFWMS